MGIREALHPMADLATEPRWPRISGTFGEDAALRAAFAVDGIMQTDWSAPLAPDAQVMVFPRVAGG